MAQLDVLIQLIYGNGNAEQKGMLADIKSMNAEFTERLVQIRSLMEEAVKSFADASQSYAAQISEPLERIRETADILDVLLQHTDPSFIANACINILKPSLLEPLCAALDAHAKAMASNQVADTVNAVISLLNDKIEEVVVLRREDIVSQVANEVRGEMMELLAVDSLRELQENYRVLQEKNRRLLLLSCAGGVGCVMFALFALF